MAVGDRLSKKGKLNYKLTKEQKEDPKSLTLDQIKEIIGAAPEPKTKAKAKAKPKVKAKPKTKPKAKPTAKKKK